jgi:hypothetical protein
MDETAQYLCREVISGASSRVYFSQQQQFRLLPFWTDMVLGELKKAARRHLTAGTLCRGALQR